MTTTLLAVDDSKTIRRVLEITFAGESYRTVLAESADDAMNKLRAERPSIALVDASLGTSSGYDLCQQIKRETPHVSVILLSSKQAPYDRARGSAAGADDFIDKPFDTQQLIDKVAAAARKSAEVPARPAAAPAPVAATAVPSAAFAGRPRATTLAYGASSGEASPAPAPAAAASPAISPRSPTFGGPPAQSPTMPGAAPPAGASAFGARPATYAQPAGSPAAATTSAGVGSSFASGGAGARAVQPEPLAPAPARAPAPAKIGPSQAAPTALSAATATDGQFAERLAGLGLTADQVQGVLALSRDVVEKVVWEVVPVLAETLIKEELQRLTSG